ncbi:MAG: DUF4290 domain-containing protein [Prevotella sp.]|jgi:hypothetical protein|nr:DUF4290 domain-containing protein [Prevotella sp.]
MEIQGLDYNTQREMLLMPEYGREIQKMVDHAVTLPSKEERLLCAKTIVKMMETKVPQMRENADYQQMLWDHLYLMSHKALDIDWPYDVSGAEKIHSKPEPMALPKGEISLRHYGRLVMELLNKLKTMEPGQERDELMRYTANQMKRDLVLWGHGSIDDEKVADDMARLTDGVIQLDLSNFAFERFVSTEEYKQSKKKKK